MHKVFVSTYRKFFEALSEQRQALLFADASGAKEFRSNMDQNVRSADEEWVTHFGFHGNPG
jgi:hypothetical protein